jgi:predicted ATPase with chaperone activity
MLLGEQEKRRSVCLVSRRGRTTARKASKLARTIADLAAYEEIQSVHLAEAL